MKTLSENYEFRTVYTYGKSYVTPVVVLYALKRKGGQVRIGITASKKIGNAVGRNRARRVIREAVRPLYPWLCPGYDYVFVARGRTVFSKSTQVYGHLRQQLKKARLLGRNRAPKTAKGEFHGGSPGTAESKPSVSTDRASKEERKDE